MTRVSTGHALRPTASRRCFAGGEGSGCLPPEDAMVACPQAPGGRRWKPLEARGAAVEGPEATPPPGGLCSSRPAVVAVKARAQSWGNPYSGRDMG